MKKLTLSKGSRVVSDELKPCDAKSILHGFEGAGSQRCELATRIVAAELEKRWEEALAALKQAEENYAHLNLNSAQTSPQVEALSEELKAAFRAACQNLPQLWQSSVIDRVHKKALLRCLIDKVVLKKIVAERLAVGIIWKGGAVTELEVAKNVGSLKELEGAAQMQQIIVERSRAGVRDEEIAVELTALGYRSPMSTSTVLVNTIKLERLKRGIFLVRHQSHRRQIAGKLTIPQLAKALDVEVHWIYDRIHNGKIGVAKNERKMYLFADEPKTLEDFTNLRDGKIHKLDYREGHQHV